VKQTRNFADDNSFSGLRVKQCPNAIPVVVEIVVTAVVEAGDVEGTLAVVAVVALEETVDGEALDGIPVDGDTLEGAPVDGDALEGAPVDGDALDGAPVVEITEDAADAVVDGVVTTVVVTGQ